MICAVVLAAGRSRRMGTQKLLLPFAGSTMIGHIVDEIARGPVERVAVVVGADAGAIAAALTGRRIDLVHNPDIDGDMLNSVRCGLRWLPEDAEAVLVALGDQPTIRAGWIADLASAFHKSGRGIVVPIFAGKRGHPLLLARRYREELLHGHDNIGLRGLLMAHEGDVLEVAMDSPEVLSDIDNPDDYQRLTRRLRRGEGD